MNSTRIPHLKSIAAAFLLMLTLTVCGGEPAAEQAETKYGQSWDSLTQHPVPEWIIDAKFGIYAHWGVYSVPAYGTEWYGKLMYDPDHARSVYAHHEQKYGGPAKFGYREFIPRFKAENYDPAAWADLIRKSGAKYAGIAVVHHDGFGLWDSKVNRWNAGQMGPRRDLYGDLIKELRNRGLKTIATFHHIRTYDWFLPTEAEVVERGRKEGWDIFDPEYKDFYWNHFTSTHDEFIEVWKAKVREVVDNYQPDVLWFDGGKFQDKESEAHVTSILSYYLNRAGEWGKEVEVLNKLPTSKKFNFPEEFGVLTFEDGRDRPAEVERPWIDDMTIAARAWGYIEGQEYKPASEIVDGLVDRVSRGGGLLLSLAPKADGTLPQGQVDALLSIGDWLAVNGDAIYETRRWKVNSEGSLDKITSVQGGRQRWSFAETTAKDIRFTRKGNTLYAIALAWPADGKITIETLKEGFRISDGGIANITMLGAKDEVQWIRDANGVTITLPPEKPCEFAYAFKIEVNGALQ